MSYFTAAAIKGTDGWSATHLSLANAADIEDVTDRLRDVDPDADVSLLFVEADDTYLAILRLDQGEDPRVFASDAAFADESRLGALLLADLAEPGLDLDMLAVEDDTESRPAPDTSATVPLVEIEPVGDAEVFADLGISAAKLRELCAHDGMLPSDITAEICQAIGCGDEVEELREA